MRLWPARRDEQRSDPVISLAQWASMFDSWMSQRPLTTLAGAKQEEPDDGFASVVQHAYRSNGIVFACVLARALIFSEAEFTWKSRGTGNLFGNPDLALLEQPWPNGTTGQLLKQMLQYADIGGNAYVARYAGRLMCLRPDWVEIVVGSRSSDDVGAWDVDSEILGYIYWPGGRYGGRDPWHFMASEVAHWAPIPDPEAQFRGMSWMTPVVREVMSDKAATRHKLEFFENAATPNLVMKLATENVESYKKFIELFREQHEGAHNAYKTLFVGAGADPIPVGSSFEQMDFRSVQGAGETRIAAAARIPPIIAGFSEGLAAATYSNYGQARRAFADGTIRPLWRDACGALQSILTVPGGAKLWWLENDISFLREDQKDAAQITSLNAISIRQLVDGGFEAPTVVAAITSGDLTRLKHSGLTSVQLQPPTTVPPDPLDNPALPADDSKPVGSGNGNGSAADALQAVKTVLAIGPASQPDE